MQGSQAANQLLRQRPTPAHAFFVMPLGMGHFEIPDKHLLERPAWVWAGDGLQGGAAVIQQEAGSHTCRWCFRDCFNSVLSHGAGSNSQNLSAAGKAALSNPRAPGQSALLWEHVGLLSEVVMEMASCWTHLWFGIFQNLLRRVGGPWWAAHCAILQGMFQGSFSSLFKCHLLYFYSANYWERQHGMLAAITDSRMGKPALEYQRCHSQLLCGPGHSAYPLRASVTGGKWG